MGSLVLVRWYETQVGDSAGWSAPEKLPKRVAETVGFIVFEDDTHLELASSIMQHSVEDFLVMQIVSIPKGAVSSFFYLAIMDADVPETGKPDKAQPETDEEYLKRVGISKQDVAQEATKNLRNVMTKRAASAKTKRRT